MKAPTKEQIAAEIKLLKTMKPTVLKTSAFGENHHDAIDAQIEVLEDVLIDEDDIHDRADADKAAEEEVWADNVRDCALEAQQWRDGVEGTNPPSSLWEALVRK